MNRELAKLLRDKLVGLPFVDVLAGLAKTVSDQKPIEGDTPTTLLYKFPVSEDTLNANCVGREASLVPDSGYKSVIYFEDFGIRSPGRGHRMVNFVSSLRLVCWMNRANLVGDHYEFIGARVMTTIIGRLSGQNPENLDIFKRLTGKVTAIQPQDAAIFSRYTYNEAERQYLRPPFEFFAIDFQYTYQVPEKCLGGINWNLQTCS